MKIHKVLGRLLLLSILFVCTTNPIYSSVEGGQLERIVLSLESSSLSQLQEKSRYLKLPQYGDREELLNSLYEYYGYTQHNNLRVNSLAPPQLLSIVQILSMYHKNDKR